MKLDTMDAASLAGLETEPGPCLRAGSFRTSGSGTSEYGGGLELRVRF